jgi:hypothetical protein
MFIGAHGRTGGYMGGHLGKQGERTAAVCGNRVFECFGDRGGIPGGLQALLYPRLSYPMLVLITGEGGGWGGADIYGAREKLRCRLLVPAQIQVPITEVLNGTRSRFLRESLFYVRSYSFAQIALEGSGKMRARQKISEREKEALRRDGSLGRSDRGRDKTSDACLF